MAFSATNLLIGRSVAENAGVDRQRATRLAAVLSSGLLDVPLPVGLVLTRTVAAREAAAAPALPTPGPGEPSPGPGAPEALITVPNLIGQTQADAEAVLTVAGFARVVALEEFSSAEEEGLVVNQSPVPTAQIGANDTLILYIGVGPGVLMPNVIARSYDQAKKDLQGLGLTVDDNDQLEEPSDIIAADHVIRQDPECGAQLREGDPVILTVSTGPDDGVG